MTLQKNPLEILRQRNAIMQYAKLSNFSHMSLEGVFGVRNNE